MYGQHGLNCIRAKKIKYDVYIYIYFFRFSHYFFLNCSNFI